MSAKSRCDVDPSIFSSEIKLNLSRKARRNASKRRRRVGEERINAFFDNLTIDLQSFHPDEAWKRFACDRLSSRMRKRVEVDRPEMKEAAFLKFIQLNDGLANFRLDPSFEEYFVEAREFISHVLERYLSSKDPDFIQESFSHKLLLDEWKYGPGASNGVSGLGTVEKINQPMTVAGQAEPLVKYLRANNPYFAGFDAKDDGFGLRYVSGSRLNTVLKNEDEVRTIAIEASGNMAVQLAGGRIIEGALRYAGIDISNQQPKNQVLARRGSKTGQVCTIDLKSASDMETPVLIRKLWPLKWYDFFMKTRSPETDIPGFGSVELNMISTMGNGYTFPMMTLTILSLIYANRRINHRGPRLWVDYDETCVFGDDIIVPVSEFHTLSALLQASGYIVNHNKSFWSGPFRESCGGDYFEGHDVTPFYARRLTDPSSIYVVINQLLSWSGRMEFPCSRSLRYLVSLLDGKVNLVPEWLEPTAGIKTSQCPRVYKHLRTIMVKHELDSSIFMMPLVCGGYVSQRKDGVFEYNPRDTWVVFKTGTSVLPEGYTDGWDPRYGTLRSSGYISLMVSIATM